MQHQCGGRVDTPKLRRSLLLSMLQQLQTFLLSQYRLVMIRHRRAEHDNLRLCAIITRRHSQAISPSTFSISVSMIVNLLKLIYCCYSSRYHLRRDNSCLLSRALNRRDTKASPALLVLQAAIAVAKRHEVLSPSSLDRIHGQKQG